jgi:hypothetical protein
MLARWAKLSHPLYPLALVNQLTTRAAQLNRDALVIPDLLHPVLDLVVSLAGIYHMNINASLLIVKVGRETHLAHFENGRVLNPVHVVEKVFDEINLSVRHLNLRLLS